MSAGNHAPYRTAGFYQRGTEGRQAVSSSNCADNGAVGPKRTPEHSKCQRKIIDRLKRTDGNAKVISFATKILPVFFDLPAGSMLGELLARIHHRNLRCKGGDARYPVGRRATEQQGMLKLSRNVPEAIEAIVKGAFIKEQFGANAGRPVAAQRAQMSVEQVAIHGRACASGATKQQEQMASVMGSAFNSIGRQLLDFALPPRFAGCGEVIDEAGAFCVTCWSKLDWLGNSGCQLCGLPLEGTDIETCGRCLADPPKIDRIRAAVGYDDISRSIALKLKYGRKVALARTMARYMAPLGASWGEGALLIPVPLHRWRLWNRGFNQSGLVARELARSWHIPVELNALSRTRFTRPLKGLNHRQRRAAVAGAFRVQAFERIRDKTIILVDDG